MSIQSRIILPHNSKTRDKLVMLTCFLKIVLDSDIQEFGQLSTFVSLNSICKKKQRKNCRRQDWEGTNLHFLTDSSTEKVRTIRAPQMLSIDKNLRNSTPANYLR